MISDCHQDDTDKTASPIDFESTDSAVSPHVLSRRTRSDKIYCTYWIRTGECDFEQQGCVYKHEMPDRNTLAKIGFRDIPRWWLEQNITSRRSQIALKNSKPKPVHRAPATLSRPERQLAKASNSTSQSPGSAKSTSSTITRQAPHQTQTSASFHSTSSAMASPSHQPSSTTTSSTCCGASDTSLSTEEDLIDFGPIGPPTSTTINAKKDSIKPSATMSPVTDTKANPAPSSTTHPAKSSNKQVWTTKQRKTKRIFVPAGESVREHLRRHAKQSNRSEVVKHAKDKEGSVVGGTEKAASASWTETVKTVPAEKHDDTVSCVVVNGVVEKA